jgi:hypothetical protein
MRDAFLNCYGGPAFVPVFTVALMNIIFWNEASDVSLREGHIIYHGLSSRRNVTLQSETEDQDSQRYKIKIQT